MNLQRILKYYIILYAFFWIIVCCIYVPKPTGEWDDYSLMTVSLIYEHNFTISQNDIIKAKKIFPEWSEQIDRYSLFHYTAKNGEELTWYFFTYSLVCVPFVLILHLIGLPAIYGFGLANCFSIFCLLYFIYRHSKIENKKKFVLIMLLSLNPIVFYLTWISAEVFIYSLLGIAILHWTCKEYHRAAIVLSLAGTLNPTIMAIGIFMIIEYFIVLLKESRGKKENKINIITCIFQNRTKIIKYGCCYLISLVPFCYNYYQIGHINLTASHSSFLHRNEETVLQRFFAYIFDWNFGFLPYYAILLFIMMIFFIIALRKKVWKFHLMILSFFAVVYAYSFMAHINSGMSGIARYNAWSAGILIIVVVSYYDKLIVNSFVKSIFYILTTIIVVSNCFIVYVYGLIQSSKVNYVNMTPIAQFILDTNPKLYNPLFSTFNSRVNHIDGGYNYENETPIIYFSKDGYVRKILASEKDEEVLYHTLSGITLEETEWFYKKLDKLGDKLQFISIPFSYQIVSTLNYCLGERILFFTEQRNADLFVRKGISHKEDEFAWTDGNCLELAFSLQQKENFQLIHGEIELAGVFCDKQKVSILVNEELIEDRMVVSGENIEFDFKMPEGDKIIIKILLPDSISPWKLGQSEDKRELALAIKSMVFTGVR